MDMWGHPHDTKNTCGEGESLKKLPLGSANAVPRQSTGLKPQFRVTLASASHSLPKTTRNCGPEPVDQFDEFLKIATTVTKEYKGYIYHLSYGSKYIQILGTYPLNQPQMSPQKVRDP